MLTRAGLTVKRTSGINVFIMGRTAESFLARNVCRGPIRIFHHMLPVVTIGNPYHVQCPACGRGMLLVCRHHLTMTLLRDDYCTHCGQAFWYLDETINGEKLPEERPS